MDQSSGELWEKHADELMRFATTLVGPFDAEDVLSAAFLAAVSSAGWAEVRNQRAYLFRAVSSHAQKVHRSRSARERRELLVASISSNEVADVEALSLLGSLTVRQRAVAWMTYWLDAPPAEIAETLSMSKRTVERELNAARRRLRGALS
jgi:RNA polymerase sigma factor (sigma-70 family)